MTECPIHLAAVCRRASRARARRPLNDAPERPPGKLRAERAAGRPNQLWARLVKWPLGDISMRGCKRVLGQRIGRASAGRHSVRERWVAGVCMVTPAAKGPARAMGHAPALSAAITRASVVSHGRAETTGRPTRAASSRSHRSKTALACARSGWCAPSRAP